MEDCRGATGADKNGLWLQTILGTESRYVLTLAQVGVERVDEACNATQQQPGSLCLCTDWQAMMLPRLVPS
jgi:hypothetical protein